MCVCVCYAACDSYIVLNLLLDFFYFFQSSQPLSFQILFLALSLLSSILLDSHNIYVKPSYYILCIF